MAGCVECQDGAGIYIASPLEPDFDAAGGSVRRAGSLERAGAHDGAVIAEAEAVAVLEPRHFISRGAWKGQSPSDRVTQRIAMQAMPSSGLFIKVPSDFKACDTVCCRVNPKNTGARPSVKTGIDCPHCFRATLSSCKGMLRSGFPRRRSTGRDARRQTRTRRYLDSSVKCWNVRCA